MARGKTVVKQSAVERATRGLLAAAAAAGVTRNIEVDLTTGKVTLRIYGDKSSTVAGTVEGDVNEWDNL